MNKTLRKAVAAALSGAMALTLAPAAMAKPSTNLLVDDIKINQSVYTTLKGQRNAELKDALAAAEGTYDNNTNSFKITKLPSSMPYIRPNDYVSNYEDVLNYGPYLPLNIRLSFWDGTKFADMTEKGTKLTVDGVKYSTEATSSMSLVNVMQTLIGAEYPFSGNEIPASILSGVDYNSGNSPLYALFGITYSYDGATKTIKWTKNDDGTIIKGKLGTPPANVTHESWLRSQVYAMLWSHSRANTITNYAKITDKDLDMLDQIITGIANAAALGLKSGTVSSYASIQKEIVKYVDKVLASGADAVDPVYYPVTVFHYLYNDMYGADKTHTVKFTAKDGETYERKFTVKVEFTNRYNVKSAAKTGINANNIAAYADGGNLYFDFSQKDILATDTWGTESTAYKLWDRSNFGLYGAWVSFKDSVKQGDTVFMNANLTLQDEKGNSIPAGTELTFTYNKKNPKVINSQTYQYTNAYKFKVADDGTVPFSIALDKADMEWMYNAHNQQYCEVTFKGEKNDVTYGGAFLVYTRSTDRIDTGDITLDAGANITMTVGETRTVNAIFSNTNAYSTEVLWSSNDASIASVVAEGQKSAKITANKVGTAAITVSGKNDGKSSIIVVDVVAKDVKPAIHSYQVVTSSSSLNVRAGMGTSFSIIGKLKKGTSFQGELSQDGDWIKLNYNGNTGYVSSKYCIAL